MQLCSGDGDEAWGRFETNYEFVRVRSSSFDYSFFSSSGTFAGSYLITLPAVIGFVGQVEEQDKILNSQLVDRIDAPSQIIRQSPFSRDTRTSAASRYRSNPNSEACGSLSSRRG